MGSSHFLVGTGEFLAPIVFLLMGGRRGPFFCCWRGGAPPGALWETLPGLPRGSPGGFCCLLFVVGGGGRERGGRNLVATTQPVPTTITTTTTTTTIKTTTTTTTTTMNCFLQYALTTGWVQSGASCLFRPLSWVKSHCLLWPAHHSLTAPPLLTDSTMGRFCCVAKLTPRACQRFLYFVCPESPLLLASRCCACFVISTESLFL